MSKFLDDIGLAHLWGKIKTYVANSQLQWTKDYTTTNNNGVIQNDPTNIASGDKAGSPTGYAYASGYNTEAYGAHSHTEGAGTKVYSPNGHAEGNTTTVGDSNDPSVANGGHAEGRLSVAKGSAAHAEGYQSFSTGEAGHSEGYKTSSSGRGAHAEGSKIYYDGSANVLHSDTNANLASGEASHIEGYGTYASGRGAHAEGCSSDSSINTASGDGSHVEGCNTTASGHHAHAEGYGTTASGANAHTEGVGTTASSEGAHAEGIRTKATGFASHTGGQISEASGANSFAHGFAAAATQPAQVAIGMANLKDTNADFSFIIGNGKATAFSEEEQDITRSNAFTVDWDGSASVWNEFVRDTGGATNNGFNLVDKNGDPFAYMSGNFYRDSQNRTVEGFEVGTSREVNDTTIKNYMRLYIDADGNPIVTINEPEAWRKALYLYEPTQASCTIASGWENYTSGQNPIVLRYGKVVTFMWQCKPTASKLIDATRTTVCTIPLGYRPSRMLSTIQQGTTARVFDLSIQTGGEVQVARLRATNSVNYDTATTDMWFPLSMTYVIP